jgi:ABC-type antimicrobial peptide transport system permease subunit
VPTVRYRLSDTEAGLHVYLPLGQDYDGAMSLHARLAGGSEESARAMLGTVAGIVREVAPDVPVLGVRTWRELRDGSSEIWVYRAGGMVFSTFAAFALLLTVIGVYGVKAYLVARRTREFGIRMAVGAGSRDVLWLVLREGSRTTALGIGIGLLLALGVSRLLQSFLYGVGGFEPIVLLTAPLVLVGASLLASYFPARRATRVDPVVALRQE